MTETELRRAIAPMAKSIRKEQKRLKNIILFSIKNAKKSVQYWNSVRGEINFAYNKIYRVFDKWTKSNLAKFYKTELKSIEIHLDRLKDLIPKPGKNIQQVINSRKTNTVSALFQQEASETFLSSLNNGRSKVIQFTRATQQTLLAESAINIDLVSGLLSGGDLRDSVKVLRGDFMVNIWSDINKEEFITAGKRKYTPKYYSELVARTKFHEAQSMAAIEQAKNYDTDLVQISTHNTTTKICTNYEGKIYSISGKSKDFPPLENTPPYHPNCLHLVFPVFDTALEVDGTKEEFSKFSKGEINKPPVPAGFVPISERELI